MPSNCSRAPRNVDALSSRGPRTGCDCVRRRARWNMQLRSVGWLQYCEDMQSSFTMGCRGAAWDINVSVAARVRAPGRLPGIGRLTPAREGKSARCCVVSGFANPLSTPAMAPGDAAASAAAAARRRGCVAHQTSFARLHSSNLKFAREPYNYGA